MVTFSELPAVVVAAKQTPNSSIDQGGGKRRSGMGNHFTNQSISVAIAKAGTAPELQDKTGG